MRWLALALLAACAQPRPGAPALVDVSTAAPEVILDIRYATAANFTGKVLYPEARCLLRRDPAERLARAQARLRERGLGLKVWDCYRPLSVQRRLWELVPDPRYVADPAKGSRHNRGHAVDLTLVDAEGRELELPTAYDDFSEKAHRDAPASPEAARNRALLQEVMEAEGFQGLATEWWHFDAPGWREQPNLDVPFSEVP